MPTLREWGGKQGKRPMWPSLKGFCNVSKNKQPSPIQKKRLYKI